jgi:short-subunit dehydrogenase
MTFSFTDKTALVTGASSGIGSKFAEAFAAKRTNLVLVARRADRLESLAAALRTKYGVQVTVLALDLGQPGAASTVETELQQRKIIVDILVNNAGFGTNARLVNEDRARLQAEIALNVGALVDLTAAFLPGMLARNSGAIVNIASTAAYQAVPGMAVYAATKAFVLSFTEAVWGETNDTGVQVFAVSPGSTDTDFFDVAGSQSSSTRVPASDVIDTTLATLTATKTVPSVIVGSRNKVMATVSRFVPRKMVIKLAGSLFLPPR